MFLNGVDIRKGEGGFYSSRDILRASRKGSRFTPDIFLESESARLVIGASVEEGGDTKEHVREVFGSRPDWFFSPTLSAAYASWLGVVFKNFMKELCKEFYESGYSKGSGVGESEIKSSAFQEGYEAGWLSCKNELDEVVSSLPETPVQIKNISSTRLWQYVFPDSTDVPHSFLKYLVLRAASYRNLGRVDLLSEYDWDSSCYWMTPEFAFSIASFFDDGSQEHLKALRFISLGAGGKVWASRI